MDLTLAVPNFLPTGETLLVDSTFYDRLHNGDASVGWVGDPRLGVYHNGGRIELWRWCEDGEPRLIVRSRPGMDRLDSGLLKFLAEHDPLSRKRYNITEDISRTNDAIEKQLKDDANARMEEAADRLHHGLLHDIGSYEGGLSKRQFVLPQAPWRKDTSNG